MAESTTHPNILMILTDDQGFGDLRSHGNELIDTPVLDRMADSGARFDRFYVSPLCAPTRAALLTGRYHLRTGVWGVTGGREVMRADEVTVAQVFRRAGYATACFGKWHNGEHYPHHPNGKGFDEFIGFCAGHWCNYFNTYLEHNGERIETQGYISDVFTRVAMDFIEKNQNGPFFCYLPYNAPHGPFQVPDRYFDKYKERGFDDRTATIYGMCENVDDNVGRLLAHLDRLGIAERTIVLFMTDNGANGARYNSGMRGFKGSVHEGGHRVPLFVRRPGRIAPGTVVTRLAAHVDILPTLADLCGVPVPENLELDGWSLRPLLQGDEADWPERAIFTHRAANDGRECPGPAEGAIRTTTHRLVHSCEGYELYDMTCDPGETTDLAAKKPQLLAELSTVYETMFADMTGGRDYERFSVPVGHEQWTRELYLQATLADISGGVKFIGKHAWAHDWLVGWTTTEAKASWKVDIQRGGRYELALMYCCPEGETGSRLRVAAKGVAEEVVVEQAHDPAPIPVADRVPRGEVVEKEWAALACPPMRLEAGPQRVEVTALFVAGSAALELKAVRIVRLDD